MAVFTAGHMNQVANVLSAWRTSVDEETHRALVERFVTLFKASNPRFRPNKFRQACGIQAIPPID